MKKYILIVALLFSAIAANAQYAPKYKELKDTFNYLTYGRSFLQSGILNYES